MEAAPKALADLGCFSPAEVGCRNNKKKLTVRFWNSLADRKNLTSLLTADRCKVS
jgi:hypothetical protein